MCWVCAGLFERLEYCEAQGLMRAGAAVYEALAEHGREKHESVELSAVNGEQVIHEGHEVHEGEKDV